MIPHGSQVFATLQLGLPRAVHYNISTVAKKTQKGHAWAAMTKRSYRMDDLRFTPIGGAKLTMLPFLSYPMFSFAVELARVALTSKDMRSALACIILSAASLEAYINELIHTHFGNDAKQQRRLRKLGTNVIAKWREVAKVKGGLDESGEPFDSFKLLVGLRGFLMHFQVEEEPVIAGEEFESDLQSRLSTKIPLRGGQVSTERYLTGACADWAVTTANQVIRELYRLGYEPPSSAWVDIVDPGRFERQPDQAE